MFATRMQGATNGTKRTRPPNLALADSRKPAMSSVVIDSDPSPAPALGPLGSDLDSDKGSPGSSAYSSPVSNEPFSLTETDSDASDDLSKDLAILEKLRKNVHKNLRLRPIRMASSPNLQLSAASTSVDPTTSTTASIPSPNPFGYQRPPFNIATSPTSSVGSPSVYYTPFSDFISSPRSAHFLGYVQGTAPHPSSPLPNATAPQGVSAPYIFDVLNAGKKRPLLIDTRQPGSYLASRFQFSVNIAIPTLILKRCRKPGGGFASIDALRQFVTTERGKAIWDDLMGPSGPWNGDVIVYDEEMNEKDRDSLVVPAWALLAVLKPIVTTGHVDFLRGGLSSARQLPQANIFLVSGERELNKDDEDIAAPTTTLSAPGTPRKGGFGLSQLLTFAPAKQMPQIEPPTPELSSSSSPPLSARRISPPPQNAVPTINMQPLPIDLSSTPSPPPSASQFPRSMKRPSAPNLRKLDTTSRERLKLNLANPPKLSIRAPARAATLAVSTPTTSLRRPNSPSHLTLVHSTHSPPGSAFLDTHGGSNDYLPPPTPSFAPSSPLTPRAPSPPRTARPDDTPSTEEASQPFNISTILPNFLYLGPELTLPEHVTQLKALGVQRILNIAIECDDDQGLNLREVFEKYIRIPMRDTVEEENVPKTVRQVCDILDDARLHSSPTYVHCKAGKSRSVTAVMAYLIHANHWGLSRAYSFVLERRKGISPNIGFVSELMNFEEQELGGKSVGVVSGGGGDNESGSGQSGSYVHAAGNRRAGHMRESLPPILPHSHTDSSGHYGGAMSATGIGGFGGALGAGRGVDGHEEMEIKDAQGRYRHAWRAPVDEQTLQPSRRVSKAGLESSSYMALGDLSDS